MKKVLIVIDYQNDFVDGTLGFAKAKTLEPLIVKKIEKYLEDGDIIFTKDTHYSDYLSTLEGQILPVMHCQKSTNGHDLYGKVKNYEKKAIKVFEKNTFGSFDLQKFVNKSNYGIIELCGLVTHMCVLSNAVLIKAVKPEANIIVDEQLVASFDEDLHQKALDILESIHINLIRKEVLI